MGRKVTDNYPTEPAMLNKLLELDRGNLIRGRVIEPAAGAGSLASGLRQASQQAGSPIWRVWSNDPFIRYGNDSWLDATKEYFWNRLPSFDWVVTNPPYSLLTPILKYSLAYALKGVAMILRISALEPTIRLPKKEKVKRGDLLMLYADNMRYLMPFSAPRPKYVSGSGTDSVTTAWFVWDKGWSWHSLGIECPFQFAVNWLIEGKNE